MMRARVAATLVRNGRVFSSACTGVLRNAALVMCVAAFSVVFPGPAFADDSTDLLDESLTLETDSIALLLEHYRVEEDLLSPDNQYIRVFFSAPPGIAAQLKSVTLYLDGTLVATESFSAADRKADSRPRSLILLNKRVSPGKYGLKMEATLAGSAGVLRENLSLQKAERARYVEFRFENASSRRLAVAQW